MSGLSMRGFGAFAAKEMLETRKTWRLWVLPGVLVFLGLTTPIMAAVTPAILKATAQRQPGVVIHFPAPTSVDAYVQFMGNLAQLALLVVIITGAAAVAGERRAGTAVLVLTKPLSRAAFVWAKVVANLAILIIATALGAALCVAVTIVLFDTRAHHRVPRVGGALARRWRRCSCASWCSSRPRWTARPRPQAPAWRSTRRSSP